MATNQTSATTVTPSLTDRELMIVFLMSAGYATQEIAARLGLRPRTVENRKRVIYEKLDVGSQSHAVAKAIWLGLLQGDRPAALGPEAPNRAQHAGQPGHGIVAVLMGPPGWGTDEVARILVSERVPLVTSPKREELGADHWLSWHRGPIVVVLTDPEPADWSAANSVGAPVVVVRSRDVAGQLAIADVIARKASGLVARADVANGLTPVLAAVTQGLVVMSSRYADALLRWVPAASAGGLLLTMREQDIIASIACGHSIRQTARALGIATKTVENIQARLFRKLGARNRMDALTIADAWGLIQRATPPGKLGAQRSQSSGHPTAPALPLFRWLCSLRSGVRRLFHPDHA